MAVRFDNTAYLGGGLCSVVASLLLSAGLAVFQGGCTSEEIDTVKSDAQAGNQRVHDPLLRQDNAYDGGLGFVVPFRPDCPASSVRKGAQPPEGFKEWCEDTGANSGSKHGWYAEWYPDGRPAVAGEYRDGLQAGVWTRWYPAGTKRVQAEFKNGLQHGRLLSWNEKGEKLGEQHYADGVPL
jgi:hypothetical protein